MEARTPQPDSLQPGFALGAFGSSTFWENVILPFVNDTGEVLKSAGFTDALDSFSAPSGIYSRKPRFVADAGATTIFIGLMVFLGSSIGSWAVGRTCDHFFDENIKPVLKRLKKRIEKRDDEGGGSFHPFEVRCGLWYEPERVLVQVLVQIERPGDLKTASLHIAAAQRAAANWLEENGWHGAALVYKVVEDELEPTPTLAKRLDS